MPGGLHRHCCCEPPEPGPCDACPRAGESITAVVSGIEMCGCMELPEGTPYDPVYVEAKLLSGSINGVHTLKWRPVVIGWCQWSSDPIARVRVIDWRRPCSGPCDCSSFTAGVHDLSIHLDIDPDPFAPTTSLRGLTLGFFRYSASEIRCEGEYQNENLICGEHIGWPLFVGGTITLSR